MQRSDLLNVPCSASWAVKIQNQVSDAIAEPCEELRQQLCEQNQLFVNESPTKQGNAKAWMWVAVVPLFTVFGIFLNRKRESLKSFIGDYSGMILNCDRAKMYFDGGIVQWCWAHLKRDIQKLIDHDDGQVERLGHDLMRQQKLLFEHWRRYKSGEIDWGRSQKLVSPVRQKFNSLLIRGSRYLKRILTVSETCRRQSRSAYAHLVDTMEASFANRPAPSLLPTPSSAKVAV